MKRCLFSRKVFLLVEVLLFLFELIIFYSFPGNDDPRTPNIDAMPSTPGSAMPGGPATPGMGGAMLPASTPNMVPGQMTGPMPGGPGMPPAGGMPPGGPNPMGLQAGPGGAMDSPFMQQQSHVFVFNTGLANKAGEAVLTNQTKSIITYHIDQPSTQQFLQVILRI